MRHFDEFQPFFVKRSIQLPHMDCNSFVLSIGTQNVKNDLENLEVLFDLGNLKKIDEIFSNKNKKGGG